MRRTSATFFAVFVTLEVNFLLKSVFEFFLLKSIWLKTICRKLGTVEKRRVLALFETVGRSTIFSKFVLFPYLKSLNEKAKNH